MRHRVATSRSSLVLAALLLSFLVAMSGCAREHQSVIFFYEAVCPSCEESQRMERLASSVIALERSVADLSAEAFDLYGQGAMEALVQALADVGLESTPVSFPLLIVGDEVFQGEAAVRQEIDRLRGESR